MRPLSHSERSRTSSSCSPFEPPFQRSWSSSTLSRGTRSTGQRAAIAASLLKRLGAGEVIHVVDGGVPRWEREGWPIER